MRKINKYNAKKTIIDGIRFDSKKEAMRYSELRIMERAGQIERLELQPEFELLPSFTLDGKKIRGVKYRADFSYYIGESRYIEDTKGYRTPEYRLKIKFLLYIYFFLNPEKKFFFKEM